MDELEACSRESPGAHSRSGSNEQQPVGSIVRAWRDRGPLQRPPAGAPPLLSCRSNVSGTALARAHSPHSHGRQEGGTLRGQTTAAAPAQPLPPATRRISLFLEAGSHAWSHFVRGGALWDMQQQVHAAPSALGAGGCDVDEVVQVHVRGVFRGVMRPMKAGSL